jgi:tetratricopeptide (TPR) repeat protein
MQARSQKADEVEPPAHTAGMVKCDNCGAETDVPQAFHRIRRSFRSETRDVCPGCWSKGFSSNYRQLFAGHLALGAAGLLLFGFDTTASFGIFALNLFLLHVFCSLVVLPHELGHALTARLLGMKVSEIVVGFGRTVFRRTLFGSEVQFKSIPYGGFAYAAPRDGKAFRLRQSLFVMAGPMANVLLLAAAWPFIEEPLSFFELDSALQPVKMFFVANAVTVAICVIPFRANTALGPIPNDGLALWQTLVSPADELERGLTGCDAFEVAELIKQKKFAAAKEYLEKALVTRPDNETLLSYLGVSHIYLREYDRARAVFLRVLDKPQLQPGTRILMLNNIAYANAGLNEPELLAEADQYSEEAMKSMSWSPFVKGTRGTVLVELGRIDEGVELLKQAMSEHEELDLKALNACHLAAAEEKRGDSQAADKYWQTARKLDPTCVLLPEKSEHAH